MVVCGWFAGSVCVVRLMDCAWRDGSDDVGLCCVFLPVLFACACMCA